MENTPRDLTAQVQLVDARIGTPVNPKTVATPDANKVTWTVQNNGTAIISASSPANPTNLNPGANTGSSTLTARVQEDGPSKQVTVNVKQKPIDPNHPEWGTEMKPLKDWSTNQHVDEERIFVTNGEDGKFYDFSENFADDIIVEKLDDGTFRKVYAYIDVREPFHMNSAGSWPVTADVVIRGSRREYRFRERAYALKASVHGNNAPVKIEHRTNDISIVISPDETTSRMRIYVDSRAYKDVSGYREATVS